MSKEVADFLDRYRLPLDIDNLSGESFDDYFNTYISTYSADAGTISTRPVITHASSKVGIIATIEKDSIERICNSLQKILSVYLEGYPSTAFQLFEKMIDESGLNKDLLKLNILKISKNKPFFRTQKNYDATPPADGTYGWSTTTSVKDVFHAPFNKRKRIGTNRFSIPGYPCLYISDDLLTSYKECTQYKDGALNAVCFRNNRPLYIADITPIEQELIKVAQTGAGDFGLTAQLLTYTKIFPIVAACHMKVDYRPAYENEVQFKIEYIVPQLLLQWFQKNAGLYIDGLKYLSCTSASTSSRTPHNYILATNFKKGNVYCPKLSALLSGTDVMAVGKHDGSRSAEAYILDIEAELKKAPIKNLLP